MESKEVAKGYRAEALKLKSVINDKGEMIGRIVSAPFYAPMQLSAGMG